MAKTQSMLGLFWCLLSLFCVCLEAFFDVNEINTVNYGISIQDKPVTMGQDSLGANVFLASKYGQQYQCTYAEKSREEELKEKEDEKFAMDTGITELLKPLENAPCLIYTKGWWTYEFCFGKHIKQYHVEDGKITGNVLYLGLYSSDFDWSKAKEKKTLRNHVLRYHSQQYVNGTECDLTSEARRTEVRFFCEKTNSEYISRVDETETCVYTLSVQTPKICKHPYLKPPTVKKEVPIQCNPLLTAEEYAEYMAIKAQEEEESLMREKYMESQSKIDLSSLDSVSELFESPTDQTDVSESDEEPGLSDSDGEETLLDETTLPEGLSNSLIQTLKDAMGSNDPDILKVKSMKVKQFKSTEELSEGIQDILRDVLGKDLDDTDSEETEEDESRDDDELDPETSPIDGEFSPANQELEEEIDMDQYELSINEQATIADDEDAMLEEFDEGIDEILETDSHLDQIRQYKAEIESEVTAHFDEILNEAQEELGEILEDQEINKEFLTQSMTETLTKLMKQLDKKSVTGKKRSASATLKNQPDEEDVSPVDGGVSPAVYDDEDSEMKAVEAQKGDIEDKGLINVEYDVQYGEQKIQVKIYTTSDYYEEATADMLETGTALNKMIIAVLEANNEEVKESKRYNEMESNYGFVWNKEKSSKSGDDEV